MKYLIVFILTLLSFSLFSQNQIGLYFGYSDSHQKYDDWVPIPNGADTSIDGMNIGISYSKSLSENFWLESRLGYVRRGAACEPGFVGIGPFPDPFIGDTDLLIDYLEIPLNISYKIPLFQEAISLNLSSGYGFSYAFRAQRRINSVGSEFEIFDVEIGDASLINRIDHGVYNGLKMEKNFGSLLAFLSAEYYYSFRDAEKLSTSLNRSISLSFGLAKRV